MKDRSDEIAAWASILGSIVALLGLLQSQSFAIWLGSALVGVSIIAVAIARNERRRVANASVSIEGLNLDSLNLANLRRRLNRSLVVQRAYHLARIEGEDLLVEWQYDGFCRADRESAIEFSIDTENFVPFNELDCFAYDLQQDPLRIHPIRPLLVGADGLSKKVAVPFLEPLAQNQPFRVLLQCRLPGSVQAGMQYYSSSLSFEQRFIDRVAVHLVFAGYSPEWVRVYECDAKGRTHLLGQLRAFKNDGESTEFVDLLEKVAGQSVRIYVYHLDPRCLLQLPPAANGVIDRRRN